jgi:hypothetical protein
MNAASSSGDKPLKRWPRVHLIYFVLAAFDLFAVIGGLYLSHRLASVFEDNAAVSTEWSERFRSVWNLSEQAAAINAPGNSVFESHDTNAERQRLADAARTFGTSLTDIQSDLIRHIPSSSLTRVSSAFAAARNRSKRAPTGCSISMQPATLLPPRRLAPRWNGIMRISSASLTRQRPS